MPPKRAAARKSGARTRSTGKSSKNRNRNNNRNQSNNFGSSQYASTNISSAFFDLQNEYKILENKNLSKLRNSRNINNNGFENGDNNNNNHNNYSRQNSGRNSVFVPSNNSYTIDVSSGFELKEEVSKFFGRSNYKSNHLRLERYKSLAMNGGKRSIFAPRVLQEIHKTPILSENNNNNNNQNGHFNNGHENTPHGLNASTLKVVGKAAGIWRSKASHNKSRSNVDPEVVRRISKENILGQKPTLLRRYSQSLIRAKTSSSGDTSTSPNNISNQKTSLSVTQTQAPAKKLSKFVVNPIPSPTKSSKMDYIAPEINLFSGLSPGNSVSKHEIRSTVESPNMLPEDTLNETTLQKLNDMHQNQNANFKPPPSKRFLKPSLSAKNFADALNKGKDLMRKVSPRPSKVFMSKQEQQALKNMAKINRKSQMDNRRSRIASTVVIEENNEKYRRLGDLGIRHRNSVVSGTSSLNHNRNANAIIEVTETSTKSPYRNSKIVQKRRVSMGHKVSSKRRNSLSKQISRASSIDSAQSMLDENEKSNLKIIQPEPEEPTPQILSRSIELPTQEISHFEYQRIIYEKRKKPMVQFLHHDDVEDAEKEHFLSKFSHAMLEKGLSLNVLFLTLIYTSSMLIFAFIYWLAEHFSSGDCLNGVIDINYPDPNDSQKTKKDLLEALYQEKGYLHVFTTAFLLSLESQTTIGYGSRNPDDSCIWPMFIQSFQNLTNLVILGYVTVMVYNRLIKRRELDLIRFSEYAVICERDGEMCLIVRLASYCDHKIIGTMITAKVLVNRITKEGELIVLQELDLDFDNKDAILSSNVPIDYVHTIRDSDYQNLLEESNFNAGRGHRNHPDSSNEEEYSPLWDLSKSHLNDPNICFELVILVNSTIESTGTTYQNKKSYTTKEMKWGYQFAQCIFKLTKEEAKLRGLNNIREDNKNMLLSSSDRNSVVKSTVRRLTSQISMSRKNSYHSTEDVSYGDSDVYSIEKTNDNDRWKKNDDAHGITYKINDPKLKTNNNLTTDCNPTINRSIFRPSSYFVPNPINLNLPQIHFNKSTNNTNKFQKMIREAKKHYYVDYDKFDKLIEIPGFSELSHWERQLEERKKIDAKYMAYIREAEEKRRNSCLPLFDFSENGESQGIGIFWVGQV